MQTLTIQITNSRGLKAIQALEEKKVIRIVDNIEWDSPALPGEQMSLKAFKDWIARSEEAPTVSFKEAKSQWTNKKKQLQKLRK